MIKKRKKIMPEVLVRSVKKALDSLDYVVNAYLHGEGATLSDIALHLDEKQPTVRNILKTMEQCGYLGRGGKHYVPGPKCGDLRRAYRVRQLLAVVGPLLERAARETGESLVLTTVAGARREVLARYQGGSEVVVNVNAVDGNALYRLVTTRAMLAGLSESELQAFLTENGEPGADWPAAADGKLDAALSELRARGYAAEKVGALAAYAVPLLDGGGALLGAAGAFAPAFRTDAAHETRLLAALAAVAEAVEKEL